MMAQILTTFILPLGGIIFIDLVLSGDNALVIGAAIVGIPRHWRTIVLVLGGIAAILLRILFTTIVTFLLRIDYIQTIGGLLVLWVTWNLLVEPEQKTESKVSTSQSLNEQNKLVNTVLTTIARLWRKPGQFIARVRRTERGRFLIAILAVTTIDISMSLDNVIAIAALAHGQLLILSIGLTLSIIILLISSSLVASLLERHPKLIILSGLVLGWIAGNLIAQDMSNYLPLVGQYMPYSSIPVYFLTLSFVALAIYVGQKRAKRSLSLSSEEVDPSHKQPETISPGLSLEEERQSADDSISPYPTEDTSLSTDAMQFTRYTDISCPRRVWIQTKRVSVVVRLTKSPSVYSEIAQALWLHIDAPIRVHLEAPSFTILNAFEQEIALHSDSDSTPLVFDLQPCEVCHTHIIVDFFQAGNLIGTASTPIEVTLQVLPPILFF